MIVGVNYEKKNSLFCLALVCNHLFIYLFFLIIFLISVDK